MARKKKEIDLADLAAHPLGKDELLVLRTCNADFSSEYNPAFIWPAKGWVEAETWVANPSCGLGLHGIPWGIGGVHYLSKSPESQWLVVRVNRKDGYVEFEDKCKYCKGYVVFSGRRFDAIKVLVDNGALLCGPVNYATATAGDGGIATVGHEGTATAGDGGTATAGDGGTATAGYKGTATAGYKGTATAGDGGTATAGDGGTATAGYKGTATAGYKGTATAGYKGTATAGYEGTATAGYEGTATAGDYGTATAGDYGTATAGDYGTATAGDGGIIVFIHKGKRAVGLIGRGRLVPYVKYHLNAKGKIEAHEQGKAVDWSKLSKWANVVAMQADGTWHEFSYIPRPVFGTQWSRGMRKVEGENNRLGESPVPNFAGHWLGSIHIRPGSNPEQDHA